jgi:ParB family chromosome partitioning protein
LDLEFHQLDLRHEGLRVRRPEKERRLLGSLSEVGQQIPIVVVPTAEPGRYLVIDGHKRLRALRRLRLDTVHATVWELSEAEALLLLHSQRADEAETAIEQAWLLLALHEGGMPPAELSMRFCRSASWVSRRLGLVRELPVSVQERVRDGAISSHAAMKYLLPMARANRSDCEALATTVAKEKLTTREVSELYAAWRGAAPPLRRRLIEDPLLFLKARRELAQEPVSANPARSLLRDLDVVGALARRAERGWREGASFMDEPEREEAKRGVDQAIADLTRLRKRMEEEERRPHAETRPEDRNPGPAREGSGETEDRALAAGLAGRGEEGDQVEVGRRSRDRPGREGRPAPPGDPGSAHDLRGEPGPSP